MAASLSKQLEIQTNYLARLRRSTSALAKALDVQSKVLKEINASIKQLQRQILKIQGAIQKGNVKGKY
jgi:hypothetical protein